MASNEERVERWPRWNGRGWLVRFDLWLVRLKEGSHLRERRFHISALLHARSDPLAEAGGCLRGGPVPRVAEHDRAEIVSVPDAPDKKNGKKKKDRRVHVVVMTAACLVVSGKIGVEYEKRCRF